VKVLLESSCATEITYPQVALLMQMSLKGQADLLRGILLFVKLHGPWRLYRMEGRPGEQRLLDLKRWGCTGIITAPATRRGRG
jgi:hypothetical protein